MRLLEDRREDLSKYHREAMEAGTLTHRARIVALPLTPYLQWELNLLKIRDETGGPVRIIDVSEISDLEKQERLPEIYTMDCAVMYQAVYDDQGVLEHALKYTDEALVLQCKIFIEALYKRGEAISSFFEREVAYLPPARPGRPAIPDDYLLQAGRPGPIRS
jgi:hypothetical protein